jgi:preprotein translocase SecE subunit
MAVAEKTETTGQGRQIGLPLAFRCLIGAVYVLFAVGMIFTGLPVLWNDVLELNRVLNPYLSDALLILAEIAMIAALFVGGRVLEGRHPPRGQRAGAVLGAIALFVTLVLTLSVGSWLSSQDAWIQMAIPLAIAVALVVGMVWLYLQPGFLAWLGHVEDLGWFHTTPFKPNQGLRVRRGTVFALLAMTLWGILIMWVREPLGRGDWSYDLPGVPGLYVPILLRIQVTVPLILMGICAWISWRIVNWPVFADFLIATEAEMNKVSWTTRRRLVQDTIVVLVTVLLLTLYLFLVDVLWIDILSSRFIRVLQIDPMHERAKLQEKTQW